MSNVNLGDDHGMYVWRDPARKGYPIKKSDVASLVSFAKNKRIRRILYDNWGTGIAPHDPSWQEGSGRQTDDFVNHLISSAHNEGILIEALYTDNRHFQKVVDYNQNNQNKFDGIRMNYEGPWNRGIDSHSDGSFHEPTSSGDIDYFATSKKLAGHTKTTMIPKWVKNIAEWWSKGRISDNEFLNAVKYLIQEGLIKANPSESISSSPNVGIPQWIKSNAGWWAEGKIDDDTFIEGIQFLVKKGIIPSPATTDNKYLPLYASISWHWGRDDIPNPDSKIKYKGVEKFSYQHILDIADGVDIQSAWGGANAVDAILFRSNPIINYARSLNKPVWITMETSDQAPPNQTFEDEDIAVLESTVETLLSALKTQNNSPAGIIYHFYMNTYGSKT